jgi:CBS domain-containing protein
MNAGDNMTAKVVSVGPDGSILQAMQFMLESRISDLPVVERKGRVVGIVTEADMLRRARSRPGARSSSSCAPAGLPTNMPSLTYLLAFVNTETGTG